jgi:hypothetical protein
VQAVLGGYGAGAGQQLLRGLERAAGPQQHVGLQPERLAGGAQRGREAPRRVAGACTGQALPGHRVGRPLHLVGQVGDLLAAAEQLGTGSEQRLRLPAVQDGDGERHQGDLTCGMPAASDSSALR